jgi:hypothetical protein
MNIKMLEQYGIAHTELKMAFVIFLPELAPGTKCVLQTRASCVRGFWLPSISLLRDSVPVKTRSILRIIFPPSIPLKRAKDGKEVGFILKKHHDNKAANSGRLVQLRMDVMRPAELVTCSLRIPLTPFQLRPLP